MQKYGRKTNWKSTGGAHNDDSDSKLIFTTINHLKKDVSGDRGEVGIVTDKLWITPAVEKKKFIKQNNKDAASICLHGLTLQHNHWSQWKTRPGKTLGLL